MIYPQEQTGAVDEPIIHTQMDEATQAELGERGSEAILELNERLQGLLDEAPSDASAEILVRKINGVYRGVLKVASLQRKFAGGSTGVNLTDLFERIFRQVHEQIVEWKRHRQLNTSDI